jgi:response regulator RpfG family c-di-GMP phosphodiesterase
VIIVVRDDGNGISTEKVRKRAEEIGFDRTLLAQATGDELLLLIFEAGFSTSDEVTETALSIKAVICDIDMPNLDGFGFLAKAKAQPNFKHIPIILLTSHTANRYRNLAFNLALKHTYVNLTMSTNYLKC